MSHGAPGNQRVLDVLKSALQDAALEVRVAAAGSLARLQPETDGLTEVLRAGLDSPHADSALLTICVLGPRARGCVGDLIKVLNTGEIHPFGVINNAYYAAVALGRIGPDAADAVPALIARLPQKPGGPAVSPVVIALARIGPGAIPELLRVIREDKDEGRRISAIMALEYMGPKAQEVIPELEKEQEKLKAKDSGWSAEKRQFAARVLKEALANIRNPNAKPPNDEFNIDSVD